jgi:hypothetical protein
MQQLLIEVSSVGCSDSNNLKLVLPRKIPDIGADLGSQEFAEESQTDAFCEAAHEFKGRLWKNIANISVFLPLTQHKELIIKLISEHCLLVQMKIIVHNCFWQFIFYQ